MQNQTTSASWQKLLELPRKSWWARLPFGVRMAAGTTALLILAGGGVAGVAAWADDGPTTVTAGPGGLVEPAAPGGVDPGVGPGVAASESSVPADDADQPLVPNSPRAPGIAVGVDPEMPGGGAGGLATGRKPVATKPPSKVAKTPKARSSTADDPGTTSTSSPSSHPHPTAEPTRPPVSAPARPVITTRTEVETRSIPFRTRLIHDPALPRGTKDVRAQGRTGVRSLRYLVTLTDGKRTGRRLLDSTVTTQPERRLIAIGVGGDDHDSDNGGDRDDPFSCAPGGSADDLCVPFGRSAATCPEPEADEDDSAGAGVIVLGDSVIDNEDVGLPDGYDWAC